MERSLEQCALPSNISTTPLIELQPFYSHPRLQHDSHQDSTSSTAKIPGEADKYRRTTHLCRVQQDWPTMVTSEDRWVTPGIVEKQIRKGPIAVGYRRKQHSRRDIERYRLGRQMKLQESTPFSSRLCPNVIQATVGTVTYLVGIDTRDCIN